MDESVKLCPRGHQSAAGSRLCITCGALFSLEVGQKIKDWTVLEVTRVFQESYYLIEGSEGQLMLAESVEFILPEQRAKLYTTLQSAPISAPIIDYFHWELGSQLSLLYTVYPAEHWDLLNQNNLQTRFDQDGLLSSAVLERIFRQSKELALQLRRHQIVLGVWHLRLCSLNTQQPILLNWHHSSPDQDQIMFPQQYLGYHIPLIKRLKASGSLISKQADAALYSFCAELLCGQSPVHWYPQPIQLQTFRSLFDRGFWQAWQLYADSQNPQQIPIGPIYQSSESYHKIKQANLLLNQALQARERKDAPEARKLLLQAQELHLVGSQIPRLIALSLSEYPPEYFSLLAQAIRAEPLACLYYDRAWGSFQISELSRARQDLETALELTPYYPEAYFLLGRIHQLQENWQKAEVALRTAIKQRNNPYYRQFLAELYRAQGKEEQANTLPMTFSVGGQQSFNTEPQMPPKYGVQCHQGHINPIDLPKCLVCGDTLTYFPGTILAGYKIIQILQPRILDGEALKGANYLAEDSQGEVKLLKEILIRHRRQTFLDAYEPLKHLSHPHLQQMEDHFVEKGFGYLVFPYQKGLTLRQLLEQQGPLSSAQVWQLLISMGAVIHYLQQANLIHGDIKPANILIQEGFHPILIDTDSIRASDETSPFRGIVHTFPFAPPEQHEGVLLPSSDPYALAVTILYSATGLYPDLFYQTADKTFLNWERYVIHLDYRLKDWIKASLRSLPAERPQFSLNQLKGFLDGFRSDQSLAVPEKLRRLSLIAQNLNQAPIGLDQAVKELQKIERSALVYHLAASAYLRADQLEEAQAFARHCVRVQPDNARAIWLIAEILQRQNLPDQALILYQNSLPYSGDFYGPYLWIARCHRALGQPKQTIKMYKQARSKAEWLLDIPLELSSFYIEAAQARSALELLNELPLNKLNLPQQVAWHKIRAQAFILQEAYKDAREAFIEALHLRAGDANLLFDLGLCEVQLKNWTEAETAFKGSLKRSPNQPKAIYQLGQLGLQQQRFNEALKYFQQLDQHWEPIDLAFQKARALTYLNRYPEAENLYQQVLKQRPSPAVCVNLANLYQIMERYDEAESLFNRALQLDPELWAATYGLRLVKEARQNKKPA